jgi:hypothetical protein
VTARDRLWALLAGILAGIAGGLFGVGGGIVIIPILTAAFGFTQHQAHGTSLAVIGFTALFSIIVYGAFANVAWVTAAIVGAASLVTARYGARLATRLSQRALARVFAVFLLLVALRLLLWTQPSGLGAALTRGVSGVAFDLTLGLAVGIVSGMMGVGGGVLVVPALVLLVGMTQQRAQGTSLAVILLAAPAGALEHARHGNVVKRLVPMLAVGTALGGVLASLGAQHVPKAQLTRAFALFLLVNAVITWTRSSRKPGRPAAATAAPA